MVYKLADEELVTEGEEEEEADPLAEDDMDAVPVNDEWGECDLVFDCD